MSKKIDIDKLVAKLGANKKTFKSELSEILTVLEKQPKAKPGDMALMARHQLLANCKAEVGSLLVDALNNSNLTDAIATKTIENYGLCELNKNATPKKPSPRWLRQIVGKWKKEHEAAAKKI